MHTRDKAIEGYYAARAPEYDAVYRKPERQPDLRAIERWLSSKCSAARVLEIACGTGYWTQFIAPAARDVTAIDAAAEMLALARERVLCRNVEFRVGDAYDLPPRGDFDLAFAGFWFSHVPKARQREFLTGMNAALRPGARVVLLDNRYVEGNSTPIAERDADGNSYQARTLQDGSRHRVLKNFPTEGELASLLDGLGERAVYTTWEYYWAFEYLTR